MLNEALTNKINSKLVPVTHAIYTVLFILIMYSTKTDIVKFICKHSLFIFTIGLVLVIYEFILYKISAYKVKDSDFPTTVNELIKKYNESNGKGIKVDLTTSLYSELRDRTFVNTIRLIVITVSPLVLIAIRDNLFNFTELMLEISGWFVLIVFIYLVFSAINFVLSSTWLFIKCKTTIVNAEYVGKVQARSDKEEDKKDEK